MKEHYLRDSSDNYLFYVILYYSFFSICFILSGAALFYQKTSFLPSGVYEYYKGSEAALEVYPEKEDRFINKKTFRGLLKSVIPHFLVYGLVIFTGMHLYRSVQRKINQSNNRTAHNKKRPDYFSAVMFSFAFFDVISGFFVINGSVWTVYLRLAVFFSFVFLMMAMNSILIKSLLVQGREK